MGTSGCETGRPLRWRKLQHEVNQTLLPVTQAGCQEEDLALSVDRLGKGVSQTSRLSLVCRHTCTRAARERCVCVYVGGKGGVPFPAAAVMFLLHGARNPPFPRPYKRGIKSLIYPAHIPPTRNFFPVRFCRPPSSCLWPLINNPFSPGWRWGGNGKLLSLCER